MSKEGKICPACGLPYSSITRRKKGNRYYAYAVHTYKDGNGKRHSFECYIGPVGKYIHGEKINQIGLKGYVIDGERTVDLKGKRFVEYLVNIVKHNIKRENIDVEKGLDALDGIIGLLAEKDREAVKKRLEEWLEKLATG